MMLRPKHWVYAEQQIHTPLFTEQQIHTLLFTGGSYHQQYQRVLRNSALDKVANTN